MRHSRLLILLLTLPLLMFAGVTSASAQTVPSVNVASAKLLAKGAGVQVVLTGSCDIGELGTFSATVTQASKNRVAQGSGYVNLTCTGETQEATIVVTAGGSGAPFHVGAALVGASIIFGCCSGVSTTEVVRIVK